MINYEKKLQVQGQLTPGLKSKKSTRNKQPTILEVNLNQQYRKHFKSSLDLNNNIQMHNSNQNNLIINLKQKISKNNSTNTNNSNKTPKQEKQYKNFGKK